MRWNNDANVAASELINLVRFLEHQMSRTYEIVCHDCKEHLWIGQSQWTPEGRRLRLYTTDERIQHLASFLDRHQFHRLEFGDDEPLDIPEDYTNANPEDDDET